MPEDLEEVRGRVNEVRRKAEGKEQNAFVATDQPETSAGHGHLRWLGNVAFLICKRKKKTLERRKGEMESENWARLKISLLFFSFFPTFLRGGNKAKQRTKPCCTQG